LKPDCVVCGDSTPHLKPHPAPLLLAAKLLNLPTQDCLYVGDDLRDVQAARAAGMRPVAVEWGYPSPDNAGPRSWNAAAVIGEPRELISLL
jgi:phosphoglycolate phosphatase